jgi:indolepyruvate ferredoxin oxidoreductase
MIGHFESVLGELLDGLGTDNVALAARIAALPMTVKGYGHVKRNAMRAMLETERELLGAFRRPPETVVVFDPRKVKSSDANRHAT